MGFRLVAKSPKEKELISQLKILNYAIMDFDWSNYKKFMRMPEFEVVKKKDKLIVIPKGKVQLKKKNKNTFEIDIIKFLF